MKTILRSIGIGLICLVYISTASAAIRVVAYNCANYPNDAIQEAYFRTILEAIGNENVNGIQKRLDILVVVEMDPTSAGTLTTILNNLYNVNTYANELSTAIGGDRTGFIYDRSTVEIIGNAVNLTNIGTHPILRAQFHPVNSTAANERFYIYAVHLQSGDTPAIINQRTTQAANLRADADALGQGTQIIYAGDFNLTGSLEGAWTNMLAAGDGQAFDPANAPGNWRGNANFIRLHSQNPANVMDDRFDFQLITEELTDGNGLDYVANSYHVFGNNGTHNLNGAITTGTGAAQNILTALANASDHLPLVADYDIAGTIPPPPTRQDLLDQINRIQQELDELRNLVEQL